EVRVTRAKHRLTWNAKVMLIAACNNCPCGWAASTRKKCDCLESKVLAYQHRLSGPILDRIDIHFNMPENMDSAARIFLELECPKEASTTAGMALRVSEARSFGGDRNLSFGVEHNRDIKACDMIKASGLTSDEFARIVGAVLPVQASSRSVIRSLRVARSIADLRASAKISRNDLLRSWSWQA